MKLLSLIIPCSMSSLRNIDSKWQKNFILNLYGNYLQDYSLKINNKSKVSILFVLAGFPGHRFPFWRFPIQQFSRIAIRLFLIMNVAVGILTIVEVLNFQNKAVGNFAHSWNFLRWSQNVGRKDIILALTVQWFFV